MLVFKQPPSRIQKMKLRVQELESELIAATAERARQSRLIGRHIKAVRSEIEATTLLIAQAERNNKEKDSEQTVTTPLGDRPETG